MAEKASMAEFVALGKKIKAGGAGPGDMARLTKLGKLLKGGQFTGTTPPTKRRIPTPGQLGGGEPYYPGAPTKPPGLKSSLGDKPRPKLVPRRRPTTGTPGGVKGGRTRQPSRTTTRRPTQARPTPTRTRTRRRPTAAPQSPRARVQRRTTRRGVRSRGRTRGRR